MAARPSLRCRVPFSFNQPIGNWDVSSVTNMYTMFYVRVPPPRVLLLSRCCVVLVPYPYPLAPRSLLTPHGRPSLAAL